MRTGEHYCAISLLHNTKNIPTRHGKNNGTYVGYCIGKTRITQQQPATWRYAVGLILELLGPQFIEVMESVKSKVQFTDNVITTIYYLCRHASQYITCLTYKQGREGEPASAVEDGR
jgi:hypothetical protein